jgi:hypothetical protein
MLGMLDILKQTTSIESNRTIRRLNRPEIFWFCYVGVILRQLCKRLSMRFFKKKIFVRKMQEMVDFIYVKMLEMLEEFIENA